MILDEPTSFMDSWAEIDWFDHFRELANGRTGIIITHRFTTVRRADIIFVMDNGEIVESGSHDELVRHGGLYAQSRTAEIQASPSLPNWDVARSDLVPQTAPDALIATGAPAQNRTDGALRR